LNRRAFLKRSVTASVALGAGVFATPAFAADEYDIVILNGRVMDPESGLDAVRSIGIRQGTIRTISRSRLRGRVTLDATGLVVAPGFIDVLAHGMDLENNRYQAHDGVTTVLALEGDTADIDGWYTERQGKMLLNYGASVGHGQVRSRVVGRTKREDAEYRAATKAELAEILQGIEQGLKRGALAVGFGLEYTPGTSHPEVIEAFRVAARYGASCHVHTRFGSLLEPDNNVAAVEEVLAASVITGAPLHIVHVPSMALSMTPYVLKMIGDAQARGMDLTACCYPYTAFGTGLGSAVFDEGWQQRFGITYSDLQWAATGERLTPETFAKYRKEGGFVIAYAIPEEAVRAAVSSPATMIGSDGGLNHGKGHPRSSGTYARILGRYVREQKALPLMEALRKMTLMPARRMEKRTPSMKNKGRLRPGADADITVFDAATIIDKSDFNNPAQYSEGVRYVLVNGVPVVKDGQLQDVPLPGQPVRAPIRA